MYSDEQVSCLRWEDFLRPRSGWYFIYQLDWSVWALADSGFLDIFALWVVLLPWGFWFLQDRSGISSGPVLWFLAFCRSLKKNWSPAHLEQPPSPKVGTLTGQLTLSQELVQERKCTKDGGLANNNHQLLLIPIFSSAVFHVPGTPSAQVLQIMSLAMMLLGWLQFSLIQSLCNLNTASMNATGIFQMFQHLATH